MDTPETAEALALVRNLRFTKSTWDGTAFVPFWGCVLDVLIDPDEAGITARQLAVLRAVLSHPRNLRPDFERALFAYYQADVDGTYCAYDDRNQKIPGSGPPKLVESPQVWGLIDEPRVCIRCIFRTETAIEFALSFNCEWDREHGLGVLYRDWQPVEFGGWDLYL